ncbi:MAG: hypothetical protein RMJ59_04120 [Candidatus Nitrosocaldus sp.]|nr:hypothetical protein [Candidatus Nitrosocaldus sp.]MDW8275552.1 hypothetical protein [Candidatus Nitrosocaldus sp.]
MSDKDNDIGIRDLLQATATILAGLLILIGFLSNIDGSERDILITLFSWSVLFFVITLVIVVVSVRLPNPNHIAKFFFSLGLIALSATVLTRIGFIQATTPEEDMLIVVIFIAIISLSAVFLYKKLFHRFRHLGH